jgi:Tfp pilus assembly protein PilF
LAGLQSGEDVRAKQYLTRSTEIAPGEPAGWADLGILQVRQQQFDPAFQTVSRALTLAPKESRIEALLGLIESRRGKTTEATAHLKKAIELNEHNLKAIYSLAEETERDQAPGSQEVAQSLLKQILQQRPNNAAVLLDDLRLAAKRGDVGEAKRAVSALQPLVEGWPDVARRQFETVQQGIAQNNLRTSAVQVQFLRNMLLRVPTYRANLDEIKTPVTLVAEPFTKFLLLPSPSSEPAEADLKVRFEEKLVVNAAGKKAVWTGAVVPNDQAAPLVAFADDISLHLANGAAMPLPGRMNAPLAANAIAGADLNYDFKTDLILATPAGVKLYRQEDPQHFRDVTSEAKISAALATAAYTGVWPVDIDLDGDLDLVLGVATGEPVILRNNGDGSFAQIHSLSGIDGLVSFAYSDLDGDGDPDIALVDGHGVLKVLTNQRLGKYQARDVPSDANVGIRAVASADINGDGVLDLVLLAQNGSLQSLTLDENGTWKTASLGHVNNSSAPSLLLGDLDNNGALDLIANGQVLLGGKSGLAALPGKLATVPSAIADLDADGRLDLLAQNAAGAPVELMNRGQKNYHWQLIRTRAAHAVGDQRMNSFGIGGVMELRADLLAQKQMITSPILHFGLGEHTLAQFARIVWPNGFVQAEFDLKADQTFLAEQRIKGSCPMLFTWNGSTMQFQKDVGPWGSALGLNVNAQGKGIYGTREWFNIGGDQLAPENGFYDLRITAEYWETYYMDDYSLLVVDHPPGSEIYTDERFALPSPTPNLIATSITHPFASARDDNGNDVTETVRALDDRFLDNFGRGQYQGLTRKHWVELTLPLDTSTNGPLYLVGKGWIHDTDATIVKAQAQNPTAHPEGMSIEVTDRSGHWTTAKAGLGFPKGRLKTVILDISGIFKPGAPHKLRLETNLELYWNQLAWGTGLPHGNDLHVQHVDLASAKLEYRGFSLITQANPSSPELPHYDKIQETDLRWHNQEGYATRYGDVRELLTGVDDRYVITSPGDELRMKFQAPPPPQSGWRRDFVLICDGWVKDGDYNSTFAGTILPLPYHDMKDYVLAPTTLEADHNYQLHSDDWKKYQTRYVSADAFSAALWKH